MASTLGTQAITGVQATTTRLQRARGPRIVHLATHGFFLPDQAELPVDLGGLLQSATTGLQALQQAEDPMLRSGLVFSGADRPAADRADDGYLTAAEATALSLDGTELVVLSACSTAQGGNAPGEGIYGLQRALTVAGARTTLLALWKVEDNATRLFMERFYDNLNKGMGRAEALATGAARLPPGQGGRGRLQPPRLLGRLAALGDG